MNQRVDNQPYQIQSTLRKIAKSCNYKQVFKATNKNKILKILNDIKKNVGPIMILVKLKKAELLEKEFQ